MVFAKINSIEIEITPAICILENSFHFRYGKFWRIIYIYICAVPELLTSADIIIQKMFLLVSVFILCFFANSRSFIEYLLVDLSTFSLFSLGWPFPDQADPTTHHLPLSSAKKIVEVSKMFVDAKKNVSF